MITTIGKGYPVTTVCKMLGLAQSTYYEKSTTKASDARLKKAIETSIMKRPCYSYQRITHELKRKGYVVGDTQVRRLLKEQDHSCSMGKASVRCQIANITCLAQQPALNF